MTNVYVHMGDGGWDDVFWVIVLLKEVLRLFFGRFSMLRRTMSTKSGALAHLRS